MKSVNLHLGSVTTPRTRSALKSERSQRVRTRPRAQPSSQLRKNRDPCYLYISSCALDTASARAPALAPRRRRASLGFRRKSTFQIETESTLDDFPAFGLHSVTKPSRVLASPAQSAQPLTCVRNVPPAGAGRVAKLRPRFFSETEGLAAWEAN